MRPANCLPIDSATLSGESTHAVSGSTFPSGIVTLIGTRGSAAIASACLATISLKMASRSASIVGLGPFFTPGCPSLSPPAALLFGPLDAIVRAFAARPAPSPAAPASPRVARSTWLP